MYELLVSGIPRSVYQCISVYVLNGMSCHSLP